MTRKYLDDINMYNRPDIWNKTDPRQIMWKDQRNTYGFDERETWSMELSWHLWLYERIKMFLEYMEIGVGDLDSIKIKYKHKKYTLTKLINMIIERLEFSFSEDYNNCDEKQREYVREIEYIWAEICPAMWW